jgi:hypothetical protein
MKRISRRTVFRKVVMENDFIEQMVFVEKKNMSFPNFGGSF